MRVGADVSRKDLKDPHAAAVWDSRASGVGARVSRNDLNDPRSREVSVILVRGRRWPHLTSVCSRILDEKPS